MKIIDILQNPGFVGPIFSENNSKFRNLSDSAFYLITKRTILVLARDRGLWRLCTKDSRAGQFSIFEEDPVIPNWHAKSKQSST